MRDRSVLGLAWRLVRAYPRHASFALACLGVSFAAGWAVAPRDIQQPPAAPTPTDPSPPEAVPAASRPGVVVRDFAGLEPGTAVDVLAEALEDAPTEDRLYAARPVLVRVDGARRWLPGDRVAVERPGALGWLHAQRDLDGDGCEDRLWHAVSRRVPVEDDRAEEQGWLVFEGCRGRALAPLGESNGWGSSETILSTRLRDVVGGTADDLLVVLATTVTEVGNGGHRVLVFHFDDGAITRALDHPVNEPVGTGLAQYEVGHVRLRDDGSLFARTMVAGPEGPLRVREETFTRNARGGFDRREEVIPLRAADGRRVVSIGNASVGVDHASYDGPRRLVVVDEAGRQADRVASSLADPRFEEALGLGDAPAPSVWDWIEGI